MIMVGRLKDRNFISKLICRRNRVLSRVLGLFDGTGAQIQDKKSNVGEKRCL